MIRNPCDISSSSVLNFHCHLNLKPPDDVRQTWPLSSEHASLSQELN